MIDPQSETLLTFSQAARIIPSSRNGKKTASSTLFRWATRGLQGVRLESIKVGGARRTSKEALTRFYRALSSQAGLTETASPTHSESDRQAEIDRATARVNALVR